MIMSDNSINILGINDGHNGSVALLKNGKLVYALSEERISRVKNDGDVPVKAIKRLLSDYKLRPNLIDYVALCGIAPNRPEWSERDKILERYKLQFEGTPHLSTRVIKKIKSLFGDNQNSRVLEKDLAFIRQKKLIDIGFKLNQIFYLDHHECHASAGYHTSNMKKDKVLILTNDGGGDGLCATVSIGENGFIKRLAEIKQENSFATLYSRTTFLMGMVPLEHEYKIMGMAPYGDKKRARIIANKIIELFEWNDEKPLEWEKNKSLPATYLWGPILEKIFRFNRFDDISAALQIVVEDMALRWVRNCLNYTKTQKIILSGGLFMNVKLNKKILELPEVKDVFIVPSCSDESNSIGAAYIGAINHGTKPQNLTPIKDIYLGPLYEDSEIDLAIKNYEFSMTVKINKIDNIENEIAVLLSKGKIVARYFGREEFGARALGNRSILSDPSRLENIVQINKMIKQRDFWMPFAASMTEEQARINLENKKNYFSPYMIISFDSKKDKLQTFRAATHPYDSTIRPQVVKRSWNPNYHKIITLLEKYTGRKSGVLNTSFNLHGFPIVSSPDDALNVFNKSGLNYLAIGNFCINKV